MSFDLATLPKVSGARLPVVYENAKVALGKCVELDECKEWSDKAAALASYAKQADDQTLQKMAERIRARAIKRCGELLKEIEPAKGSGAPNVRGGVSPDVSRSKAARDAGLSDDQRKTALRVANVPDSQFEQMVESDNPPTITELAEIGKKPRTLIDLCGRDPEDFAQATALIGLLRSTSAASDSIDIKAAFRGLSDKEKVSIVDWSRTIILWLDGILSHAKNGGRK